MAICLGGSVQAATPPQNETAQKPLIFVGFVGGYANTSRPFDGVVRFAAHLRTAYPAAHVEVFQNRKRKQAYRRILQLLDTDGDGVLTTAEKQSTRIIIYGESWGSSEVVSLARELQQEGIPVLLTVQVDSIAKSLQDDGTIPANVRAAANFYQPHGLLHGRHEIRAADPTRTRILGNFRFDYRLHPIPCDEFSWLNRTFSRSHIQIQSDPRVWDQIDSLIRAQLAAAERENALQVALRSSGPDNQQAKPSN